MFILLFENCHWSYFFFYLDDDYVKIKIRVNILMSIEIINGFEKESGWFLIRKGNIWRSILNYFHTRENLLFATYEYFCWIDNNNKCSSSYSKIAIGVISFFIWTMIMLRLRFRVNILIEIINEFEKESGWFLIKDRKGGNI